MGRNNESWLHTKAQQKRLMQKIFKASDPVELMMQILQQPQSSLQEIHDRDNINSLKKYLNAEIKANLQKIKQSIQSNQDGKIYDQKLLNTLRVLQRLMRSQLFYKDNIEFEQLYASLFQWSQNSQVFEILLTIIISNSFKTESIAFYHYIKFFVSHLNSYGSQQISVKDLLKTTDKFQFVYASQNNNHQIKKVEIKSISGENIFTGLRNFYQMAKKINQVYQLGLSETSFEFKGLVTKLKLALFEDRNSAARIAIYGCEIFFIIDIAWLRIDANVSVPHIFSLPPKYPMMLRQSIEVVFESNSEPKTCVVVLQMIDKSLSLQDQQANRLYAQRQILDYLAEQSQTYIYDILVDTLRYLENEEPLKLKLQLLKDENFLKQIIKLIGQRVSEAKQLFASAQNIGKLIIQQSQKFKNQEIVQFAGKIIIGFDSKEESIMELILKKIKQAPQIAAVYVRILNNFYNAKVSRQRRDLGFISRTAAQSQMFIHVWPQIQRQAKQEKISSKSLTMQVIKFISFSCSESPVLVDQIEAQNKIISNILEILKNPKQCPKKTDDLMITIIFVHHICLRQGPVRSFTLDQHYQVIIFNMLTSDQLISPLLSKGYNLIFTQIARFMRNIEQSSLCVVAALHAALTTLVQNYKVIGQYTEALIDQPNEKQIQIAEKLAKNDQKIATFLRIIEKMKQQIFPRCPQETLYGILLQMEEMVFKFEYALTGLHLQDRLLVALITQVKKHLKIDKKTLETSSNTLHVIEQQNQQRSEQENQQQSLNLDVPPIRVQPMEQEESHSEVQQGKAKSKEEVQKLQKQRQQHLKALIKNQQKIMKIIQESGYIRAKECIEKFKMVNLNIKKQITIPRKFHQLILEDQYNRENAWQVSLIHTIPILERYLHNLVRNYPLKKIENRVDIIYMLKQIYDIANQIVTKTNAQIMENNIEKLDKSIFTESAIQKNYVLQKRIKESVLCKEVHNKIIDNLTSIQYFVDAVVKISQYCLIELPQSSPFHRNYNKSFIQPELERARQFLKKVHGKNLQTVSFYEIDQIRFTIRILNEIFCVSQSFRQSKSARKKYYPMNNMIVNHFFFLPEAGYSVLDYLSQALEVLTPLRLSAKRQYSQSFSDKRQCIKVTMIKIAINRIKLFIEGFKETTESFTSDSAWKLSSQAIKKDSTSKVYFVNDLIHQKILNFITRQPLYIKHNSHNNSLIFKNLIANCLESVGNKNIEHPVKWHHLADLPWQQHHQRFSKQNFESKFKEKTQQLMIWLKQNLHYQIPCIDSIWFHILCRHTSHCNIKEPLSVNLTHVQKQSVWNLHKQISEHILIITKEMFPTLKLDLGIKHPVIKQQICYLAVDTVKNVRKLCNLLYFVYNQIKFYNVLGLHSKGNLIVSSGYIQNIVLLAETIMQNFSLAYQNNEIFTQQANQLTIIITNVLKIFIQYKLKRDQVAIQQKKQERKKKKKLKRQLKKIKSTQKEEGKKKVSPKPIQKEKQQSVHSSMSQKQKKRKVRKSKRRMHQRQGELGSESVEQQPIQRRLRRDKSMKNLAEGRIIINKQVPKTNKKKKLRKKKLSTNLDDQATSFIKTVFQVAEKHAFLSNRNMQAIMKLVSHSINIQKYNKYPKIKLLKIDAQSLIKSIMRVQLKDVSNEGIFYRLCELGYQIGQSSIKNKKINQQMLVKRFFFEKLPQKQVKVSVFYSFFKRVLQDQISIITPIVQLHVRVKKSRDGSKQQSNQTLLQLTQSNLNQNKNNDNAYVCLKEGVQFHTLQLLQNENKSKKQLNASNQKSNKLIDYVPQGNLQSFIDEVVQNIIRLLVRDSHKASQKNMKQRRSESDVQLVDAFTINSLFKVLQVLLRGSPSLIPYTIKLKCRKFLKKQLEQHECKKKESQFINILGFKQNHQFNFLEFLCRFASPVSINITSCLIMDLCLDNVPLHIHKGQPCTFAHVTRIKVLAEIQKSIKSEDMLIKILGLNMLTNMVLIKKLAQSCIEGNIINLVRQEYLKIANQNGIYKHFVFPYFIKPMEILHQLSFTLPLAKKNKDINDDQQKKVIIGKVLDKRSISAQLLTKQYFQRDKFMPTWPHARISEDQLGQEDQMGSQMNQEDSEGQSQLNDDYSMSLGEQNSLIDEQGNEQMIQQMPQQQSRNSWLRQLQQLNEYRQQEDRLEDQQDGNMDQIQVRLGSPSQNQFISLDQLNAMRGQDLMDNEDMDQQLDSGDMSGQEQDYDQEMQEDSSQMSEINEDEQGEFYSEGGEAPPGSMISFEDFFNSQIDHMEQHSNYSLISQSQLYHNFQNIISQEGRVPKGVSISVCDELQLKNIQLAFSLSDKKQVADNQYLKSEMIPFYEYLSKSPSFNICKFVYFYQFYKMDHDEISTFKKPVSDPISFDPVQEEPIEHRETNIFGAQRPQRMRRIGYIVRNGQRIIGHMDGNPQQLQNIVLNRHLEHLNQHRMRQPTQMFENPFDQLLNQRNRRHPHGGQMQVLFRGGQQREMEEGRPANMAQNRIPIQWMGSGNNDDNLQRRLPVVQINDGQIRLFENEGNMPNIQDLDVQLRQFLESIDMNMADFNMLPTEVRSDMISQFLQSPYQGRMQEQLQNQNMRIQQHEQGQQIDQEVASQEQDGQEMEGEQDENIESGALISPAYQRRDNGRRLNEQPQIISRAQINLNQQPRRRNQQIVSINVQTDGQRFQFFEKYQKIFNEYVKKVSKDSIQSAIRLSKTTNHKFFKVSDELIQSFFVQLYELDQNVHIYYSFKLIESLCIQHQNSLKIFSTFIGILKLGPNLTIDPEQMSMFKIPKTILKGLSNQMVTNYPSVGYKGISLKILHILSLLFKHNSFCSLMLEHTAEPLNPEIIKKGLQPNESFLEAIISLLEIDQIRKEKVLLFFFIESLFNIVNNNYCKSIHTLFQKQIKEDKKEKQSKPKAKTEKDIDFSIVQSDKKIQLSQKSIGLLCDIYLSQQARDQYSIISKIIIRLCLNTVNLKTFLKRFKHLIIENAKLEIEILNQLKNKAHQVTYNSVTGQSKIVRLMSIIGEIEKQMSYKKSRKQELYQEFTSIASSQPIQRMCQAGIGLIQFTQKTNMYLSTKVNEVSDCFFIIYKMVMDNLEKPEEDIKQKQINIAQLGQISFAKNISQQEAIDKKEKQLQKRQKIIIGDFDLDELWERKICTVAGRTFINASIKRRIRTIIKSKTNKNLQSLDIPILSITMKRSPHMLQFQNKKSIFKIEVKKLKSRQHYDTTELLLNREQVFEQSFKEFMSRRPQDLKKRLKIQFEGEEGQDVGGVTREWFQILSKEMFNPNYALFKPSSTGNTFQPSPFSYVNAEHLDYFKFIGRVMAKALLDGFLLDAYFTPAFYKHILSLPITYQDIQQEDFEYYNSLKWILQNSPIEQYLDLDFTYERDNFGQTQVCELIPGGKDIKVTQQNKVKYVQMISYAKMALSVKKQLEYLLAGFHQLIPRKLIQIFDSKELEIMISGLPTIDIADLKKNTDLVNFKKDDGVIVWLFEVLQEFNQSLRAAFLQFVTGTSRVPSEGFKGLKGFNGPQKFNIHKMFDTTKLPRAHTCFNQLDLPNYPSKQMLVQKLTYAITQCKQGFGFV